MRKLILYSLLLLVATTAFGHAGETHTYMGTVTEAQHESWFTLKKTDGKSMQVEVSKNTTYVHADGSAASRTEVVAGRRVVVTISKDGKTAATVKLAAKHATSAAQGHGRS